MKKIFRHISAFMLSIFLPVVTHAQACANGDTSGGLCNPLNAQFSTVPAFIAGALKVLVIVALPLIGLFVVVAGFMFVFARGNESKLEKAKENFLYVIIGGVLILGAWLIATLIGGTVNQLIGS